MTLEKLSLTSRVYFELLVTECLSHHLIIARELPTFFFSLHRLTNDAKSNVKILHVSNLTFLSSNSPHLACKTK